MPALAVLYQKSFVSLFCRGGDHISRKDKWCFKRAQVASGTWIRALRSDTYKFSHVTENVKFGSSVRRY